MSYTPPDGAAADFEFAGAYIPYEGYLADLSLEAGSHRAHPIRATWFGSAVARPGAGFSSTTFGLPAFSGTLTVDVSGSASTGAVFGEPRAASLLYASSLAAVTTFGTAEILPRAEPIHSTIFGTAHSPYPQSGAVSGTVTTAFGAPRLGSTHLVFASTPSTTVSQAYTPSDQVVAATGVSRTRFGTPIFRALPLISSNTSVQAEGAMTTGFGTPRSPYAQSCAANSLSTTRFGWPRGSEVYAFTIFGSPRATLTAYATGWASGGVGTSEITRGASPIPPTTTFGEPSAHDTHRASAVATTTRFGAAVSFDNGHRAFGIDLGRRFGRPSATSRIGRRTSGARDTQFGTPTAAERHLITHMPPVTTFGTPLLTRIPTC